MVESPVWANAFKLNAVNADQRPSGRCLASQPYIYSDLSLISLSAYPPLYFSWRQWSSMDPLIHRCIYSTLSHNE